MSKNTTFFIVILLVGVVVSGILRFVVIPTWNAQHPSIVVVPSPSPQVTLAPVLTPRPLPIVQPVATATSSLDSAHISTKSAAKKRAAHASPSPTAIPRQP